ncbi:unnamed protein product [Eruca vesicaria subsp. sativa]|uniref:Uncharacterized protein n=1 Tax=Eruca vesicaria subsp. sativa TaxID=29727 RepID=A0ABC8LB16_ERUVS|nr:unnamed protein product [Eruca vesicaria subsp. sativa]
MRMIGVTYHGSVQITRLLRSVPWLFHRSSSTSTSSDHRLRPSCSFPIIVSSFFACQTIVYVSFRHFSSSTFFSYLTVKHHRQRIIILVSRGSDLCRDQRDDVTCLAHRWIIAPPRSASTSRNRDRSSDRTSDRALGGRNERSYAARRFESRHSFGPYDRRSNREWREKPVTKARSMEREWEKPTKFNVKEKGMTPPAVPSAPSSEHGIVEAKEGGNGGASGSGNQSRTVASIIVSPPLRTATMEDNATIRSRSAIRSLSFVADEAVEEREQVIEALADMETNDTDDVTKMTNEEYDDAEDDLLGEEFMEANEEKRVGGNVGLRNKADSKKRFGSLNTSSKVFSS